MKFLKMVLMGVMCILFAARAEPQDKKPICVLWTSYGKYESDLYIRNVFEQEDVVYENSGGKLPAELNKFSSIFIFYGLDNPISEQQGAEILKYIENGGHVVLISCAPNIAKNIGWQNVKWIGIKSVTYAKKDEQAKVLKPLHPFLKNVFEKKVNPSWLIPNYVGIPASSDFEVIIGFDDGRSFLGWQKIGNGWVAHISAEFFRMKSGIPREDWNSYYTLIRNIVSSTNPLKYSEQLRKDLEKFSGLKVLLWNREWQRGEQNGPRFIPVLPEEKEIINSLSADLCVDESEYLQLNVTSIVEPGIVSWSFVSKNFPVSNLTLFVQDRVKPILWPKDPEIAKEFPYWLIPPEYLEPEGKKEFKMAQGETKILWLKVEAKNMKPGSYEVFFNLAFEKGEKISIPINIKIYPVIMPEHRIITLEAGGQVYGDVNNPGPALRFSKNLQANGFEWSLINAIRPWTMGVVGEQGKLDEKLIARIINKINSQKPPKLDLSSWDTWVEQAISHGLIYFRIPDPVAAIDGTLGKTKLSDDEKEIVRKWFSNEIKRYLEEKGIRLVYISYGDELSEKELREIFIPWAKKMTQYGWGCSSTFTGKYHLNPELNNELYPYVKVWTLNRALVFEFMEKLKNGILKVRSDAITGTYGAGRGLGVEHRNPMGMSRFLGWESWYLGIRQCSPNPYFKGWLYYTRYDSRELGIGGERWVSYIDKDNENVPIADCPFLIGIKEGMEEGNLAAILDWYLDALETKKPESPALKSAREKRNQIIGMKAENTIRLEDDIAYEMRVKRFPQDNRIYQAAKKQLLEILTEIRKECLEVIKPTVFWNDIVLIKEGKIQTAIYGHYGGILAESIRNLSGITIPVFENVEDFSKDYEVSIVTGNSNSNKIVKNLVEKIGLSEPDDVYPGKGNYFIREIKNPSNNSRILWIGAPDDEGAKKGVLLFSKFLRGEGTWFCK
ncbi:MAG: hypothetical protein NC906_01265 [Candidatus Omnitrophica bacterium]|nr:hypothetical protein [Candidatus Omnitrophota bacterium]